MRSTFISTFLLTTLSKLCDNVNLEMGVVDLAIPLKMRLLALAIICVGSGRSFPGLPAWTFVVDTGITLVGLLIALLVLWSRE